MDGPWRVEIWQEADFPHINFDSVSTTKRYTTWSTLPVGSRELCSFVRVRRVPWWERFERRSVTPLGCS